MIPKSIFYDSLVSKPNLRPAKAILNRFNAAQLKNQEMVDISLTHLKTGQQLNVEVYVTSRDSPILSIAACRTLNLIRIVDENICAVETIDSSPKVRALCVCVVFV